MPEYEGLENQTLTYEETIGQVRFASFCWGFCIGMMVFTIMLIAISVVR